MSWSSIITFFINLFKGNNKIKQIMIVIALPIIFILLVPNSVKNYFNVNIKHPDIYTVSFLLFLSLLDYIACSLYAWFLSKYKRIIERRNTARKLEEKIQELTESNYINDYIYLMYINPNVNVYEPKDTCLRLAFKNQETFTLIYGMGFLDLDTFDISFDLREFLDNKMPNDRLNEYLYKRSEKIHEFMMNSHYKQNTEVYNEDDFSADADINLYFWHYLYEDIWNELQNKTSYKDEI